MHRRRLLLFATLAILAIPTESHAQAANDNVSGTWYGDFVMTRPDGKVSHDKAVLVLDQRGTMLSGSAGATVDQQTAFTSGVAENGEVRFHLDAA